MNPSDLIKYIIPNNRWNISPDYMKDITNILKDPRTKITNTQHHNNKDYIHIDYVTHTPTLDNNFFHTDEIDFCHIFFHIYTDYDSPMPEVLAHKHLLKDGVLIENPDFLKSHKFEKFIRTNNNIKVLTPEFQNYRLL